LIRNPSFCASKEVPMLEAVIAFVTEYAISVVVGVIIIAFFIAKVRVRKSEYHQGRLE
jgi:hypothetical protein